MVSIVQVWERMNQLAKSGTSGYDDQTQFNSKARAVSLMIPELFLPNFEQNRAAQDALALLVESETATAAADGKVTKPIDYLHLLDLGLVLNGATFLARPVRLNAVNRIRNSSVRKRSLAAGKIAYYFKNDNIYVLPNEAMQVELVYLRKPAAPAIVLTPSEDVNSDYLSPVSGTDFEFPEHLLNLIVYLMLEQFGVEMKEQLLVEYAELGITRELTIVNPTPKN